MPIKGLINISKYPINPFNSIQSTHLYNSFNSDNFNGIGGGIPINQIKLYIKDFFDNEAYYLAIFNNKVDNSYLWVNQYVKYVEEFEGANFLSKQQSFYYIKNLYLSKNMMLHSFIVSKELDSVDPSKYRFCGASKTSSPKWVDWRAAGIQDKIPAVKVTDNSYLLSLLFTLKCDANHTLEQNPYFRIIKDENDPLMSLYGSGGSLAMQKYCKVYKELSRETSLDITHYFTNRLWWLHAIYVDIDSMYKSGKIDDQKWNDFVILYEKVILKIQKLHNEEI